MFHEDTYVYRQYAELNFISTWDKVTFRDMPHHRLTMDAVTDTGEILAVETAYIPTRISTPALRDQWERAMIINLYHRLQNILENRAWRAEVESRAKSI